MAADRRSGGADAPLRQAMGRLAVLTRGVGATNLTAEIDAWLERNEAADGLLTILLRHTSASLTIQENASPEVLPDLADALDRLAPRDRPWRHDLEGEDDMPAHVKTTLTGVSLAIPVRAGGLDLGAWQAIWLLEHRDRGGRRELSLHYLGTLRLTTAVP
ncbi:MAG: secondary thiamine-phosphate synthase enzyme YjbQ [Hyphomicrobiales bacterium]|nr:secondary thiamine-phosphate synthase enzyme YjbQ [Hyphomicrobiales bacterium]